MRIIKFLFTAIFITAFIGGLVFLVLREVVLVMGASMLSADYKNLQAKNYGQECASQYGYPQDYFTQLRFISNKEYQKEVVCVDFTSTPIILENKKLPVFLFKTSFGSGFVIDERETPSVIELSSLGRKIFVYTEEGKMRSNYLRAADLDYDLGPISSCQAHDFICCNLEVQGGDGEQLSRVNDCPKSCYSSCLLRPVILSFNSRPAFDAQTRLVEVRSGESVAFSYVIGNGKNDVFAGQISEDEEKSYLEKLQILSSGLKNNSTDELALPVNITIDFGDGEKWQNSALQDTTEHQYSCASKTCFFQVKLSASDARGVLSVDNELAKLRVRVDR